MPAGGPLRALPFFYFFHIQKAAGTSVRAVLRRMFGREYVRFTTAGEFERQRELKNPEFQLSAEFYGKLLLLGGHFGFDHPLVQRNRFGRKRVHLSVWREPVKRVVSLYDYVRAQRRHFLLPDLSQMTLADAFAKSLPFRNYSINHQFKYTFGTADQSIVSDMLAKYNYVLGTTSNLERFVDAVSAVSGLPRPASLPRVNSASDLAERRIEPAEAQSDYSLALEQIAEANHAEAEFIDRYLSDVLVTNSREPVLEHSRPETVMPDRAP